jgi:hypothetical protein
MIGLSYDVPYNKLKLFGVVYNDYQQKFMQTRMLWHQYKAVLPAILLYRSETWVMTATMEKLYKIFIENVQDT